MVNFCYNCGNKLDERAYICPKCGVIVGNNSSNNNNPVVDNGGFAWGLLGFFVPVAGLILYICLINDRPKTAKSAGKGALISVIIGIVIYILLFVFMFILGISEVTYEENNMPNNSTIREHHTDTYYKFE